MRRFMRKSLKSLVAEVCGGCGSSMVKLLKTLAEVLAEVSHPLKGVKAPPWRARIFPQGLGRKKEDEMEISEAACGVSRADPSKHFVPGYKKVGIGSGAGREVSEI